MRNFIPKEFLTQLSTKISEHPLSLLILLFFTVTSFMQNFQSQQRAENREKEHQSKIELIHANYQQKLEQCNQRYIERLEHQTKVIERNTMVNEKLIQILEK